MIEASKIHPEGKFETIADQQTAKSREEEGVRRSNELFEQARLLRQYAEMLG